MKRYLILLLLFPVIACSGISTPRPSTPTADSGLPTFVSPTTNPDQTTATQIPPTDLPPDAQTFPDSNMFTWQLVVSGLERPVDLQADGSGRLFVIEKVGRIRIIQDGKLLSTPFLNITDRVGSSSNEQGLLGLTFHPNYVQNGRFFINYTNKNGDTEIARFQVSGDPNTADPNTELKLLGLNQPFPNHNGGGLDFGPDGYLYAGLGDGGLAGDPFGNAQKANVLLGKILRLDVDSAEPYVVPADNPFQNEIWAYGLRNPWRISFDMATGDLFIGDVGQGEWEEVDYLPAGSPGGTNFGWDFREGKHDYEGTVPAGLTEPVSEYSHSEGGCSVTGGYVYRGSVPEWNGVYLYGDYCTGKIWGLIKSANGWQVQLLFETGVRITSFGQDETGEIYLVSDAGDVYKLARK